MTQELAVTTQDNSPMNLQTVAIDDINQLDDAVVANIDLMADYWSPQNVGEFKKVLFDRIETCEVLDQKTGELMELECAFFYVRENGAIKRIRNGSKRLVGAFGHVPSRTPWLIRYLGKRANTTNANKSDNWSVNPLLVNVKPNEKTA